MNWRTERLQKVAVILAVAAAAVFHSPAAYAGTTVTGDQAAKYQLIVNQSYVPTPDVTVQVVMSPTGCPELPSKACTSPDGTIIYVLPGTTRANFLHELGHVFDFRVLTDAERAVFLDLMGETGRTWVSSPNSPHEQFAEAYRMAALGPGQRTSNGKMAGGYEYKPTPWVHRQIVQDIKLWASPVPPAAPPAQPTPTPGSHFE